MADLNRSRLVTEEELIKDISEYVRTYSKGKGFRLVYDITGRSLNRMPVLLLYPEDEEITPEVLTEINKGHEEELKQATTELEALRKAAAANAGNEADLEAGKGVEIKPAVEAAP
jgi:Skp family chaperone for outer membrane proteins